jgi:hypothetical protein
VPQGPADGYSCLLEVLAEDTTRTLCTMTTEPDLRYFLATISIMHKLPNMSVRRCSDLIAKGEAHRLSKLKRSVEQKEGGPTPSISSFTSYC